MPVRFRFKMVATVSSTSAEEKDLGDGCYEIVTDTQGEGGAWKTNVPAGSTDVQVYLGNLADAKFLAVRTNSKDPNEDPVQVTLKRNAAGGEELPVLPIGDTKSGFFVMSTTGLTALYATNAGAVDMELIVFAAGD